MIELLGKTIEIHICSLNEEKYIERTLKSIKDQCVVENYPDEVTTVLVDSYSTDNTVKLAKKYVDKIILAPRGKLNARDYAIRHSNAEIIVACDADTLYPRGTILKLIGPMLHDKNIIAVGGACREKNPLFGCIQGFLENYVNMFGYAYLSGRNSAFIREAYLQMGGFNLNINQTNIYQMVMEEEITFAEKLEKTTGGKTLFLSDCVVYTSDRRINPVTNAKYFEEILSGTRF